MFSYYSYHDIGTVRIGLFGLIYWHNFCETVWENQVKRGRGRPRKTIRETIRKDSEVNELDPNMVYDITL